MTQRYKDISLSLTPNPVTGDVSRVVDDVAIQSSLIRLVQYGPGDKPFHPEISSRVRSMLFENINPVTAIRLQQEIERTIRNFEPRVRLSSVTTTLDNSGNGYNVTIEYTIRNQPEPKEFSFVLDRIR